MLRDYALMQGLEFDSQNLKGEGDWDRYRAVESERKNMSMSINMNININDWEWENWASLTVEWTRYRRGGGFKH